MKKVALALALLLLAGWGNQTSALPGDGVVDDCSSIQSVKTENKSAMVSCLDGNSTFDLGQIKGPALINVWGSWCWPCQQEMPLFVEFYGKYKEKVGLIGVNVEEADIEDARKFVKSYGMTWPRTTFAVLRPTPGKVINSSSVPGTSPSKFSIIVVASPLICRALA